MDLLENDKKTITELINRLASRELSSSYEPSPIKRLANRIATRRSVEEASNLVVAYIEEEYSLKG
jgi:hypothetical protein